jgi:proline iminopeptidase
MRMNDSLPNAKLKVFQNSSHMPFYEEPKSYFKILEDFLSN